MKFSIVGWKRNVGGVASASLWVLKAVRMIQSNGKKYATETTAARPVRPQPPWRTPRARYPRATSGLRAPLLDEIQVEIGQDDHDEEKNVGQGRGLAGAEVLEREAVDVDADRLGRRARSALGQEEDHVEDLERLDGAEEEGQQQASDVGEGDRPEATPPGGPVDLGGLI